MQKAIDHEVIIDNRTARKQLLVGFCAALLATASASAVAANNYPYASVCPKPSGGKDAVDPWKFYKCECTSYAAAMLNRAGIPFNNSYKDVRWGNASNWLAAAKAAKVAYSTTPKVGSIAFFAYGHVAPVDAFSSTSVTISEYNFSPKYGYSTRTLKKGTTGYPLYFIHITK